jgi:hypothetical protein
MITKRFIAEQVLKILQPRLSSDQKVDIREAEAIVAQCRDGIAVSLLTGAAYQDEMDLFGGFISDPEELTIQQNSNGEYYAQLTFKPLDLPKNMGIYAVSSKEDLATQYIPIQVNFNALFLDNEARDLENNVGYSLRADKLVFTGDIDEGSVLVTPVKSGHDIGSRDYFPIPPSYEKQLITEAVEILSFEKQIPEDIINNGMDG